MNQKRRLLKLAELLFVSEIPDEVTDAVKQSISILKEAVKIFNRLEETFQKNLSAFNDFEKAQADVKELWKFKGDFVGTDSAKGIVLKQRDTYNTFLKKVEEGLVFLNKKINNISVSDDNINNNIEAVGAQIDQYSDLFKEYIEICNQIGDSDFIEKFKKQADALIERAKDVVDVINNTIEHMEKNVLGEIGIS